MEQSLPHSPPGTSWSPLQTSKTPVKSLSLGRNESYQILLGSRQCPGPQYSKCYPNAFGSSQVVGDVMPQKVFFLEKDFPGDSLPIWDNSNKKSKQPGALYPLCGTGDKHGISHCGFSLLILFPEPWQGDGEIFLGFGSKTNKGYNK